MTHHFQMSAGMVSNFSGQAAHPVAYGPDFGAVLLSSVDEASNLVPRYADKVKAFFDEVHKIDPNTDSVIVSIGSAQSTAQKRVNRLRERLAEDSKPKNDPHEL